MLYVFVACTVASVCLFVRAYIVDMVEDKMLSRFFLLLGIAMLMAGERKHQPQEAGCLLAGI